MTRWDSERAHWEHLGYWCTGIIPLFQSILIQAIADLQVKIQKTTKLNTQTHYRTARRWILSNQDGYIFSFEQICTQLGLDPRAVREALAPYLCPALRESRAPRPQSVRQAARRKRYR